MWESETSIPQTGSFGKLVTCSQKDPSASAAVLFEGRCEAPLFHFAYVLLSMLFRAEVLSESREILAFIKFDAANLTVLIEQTHTESPHATLEYLYSDYRYFRIALSEYGPLSALLFVTPQTFFRKPCQVDRCLREMVCMT